MFSRLSIPCLALLLAAPLSAQTPSDTVRVGLSDAIARAVDVSPDILAVAARARFAEGRLDQGRASRYLTEFNATTAHAASPALHNPNGTPTDRLYLDPDVRNDWEDLRPFSRIDIDMVQPLWTWGELGRTIDAAQAGLDLEVARVDESRLDVAERTGRLYFTLVLLEALDRLTEEANDAVERAREEVDKQLMAGAADVDDADLFQVQITEQEVRRRVVRVREDLRTARMALRRQLMLPDHVHLEVEDRFLNALAFELAPLSTYHAQSLTSRPELAQATAGVAARTALVDVARSNFYPKLFWGVSANYSGTTGRFRQRNPYVGDSFLSRSLETGLGMRLQLNFAQTRSKVKQARAELNEVQHLESAARQLVLFEVEEAYRRVIVRREELDAVQTALRLSRTWLQTEYVNFDLELGDTDNLIKAVQAKLELEATRHQAVFDLNVAILGLQKATGTLEPMMAH